MIIGWKCGNYPLEFYLVSIVLLNIVVFPFLHYGLVASFFLLNFAKLFVSREIYRLKTFQILFMILFI